jgi:hypothetical protein
MLQHHELVILDVLRGQRRLRHGVASSPPCSYWHTLEVGDRTSLLLNSLVDLEPDGRGAA